MCRHPCGASMELPGTKDPIEIPASCPAPGFAPSDMLPHPLLILCYAPQFSYRGPVKESVFALLSHWDVFLIFVLVKFKHGRRCIRVIETFFRLRCSNILCLPRFFVPCDIQTFPGSAKKDKYLRSSLFVMMMILMRRTVILMILLILIHSSRRDDKWSQISSL